jgi:hypothetical protein
MNIRRPEGKRAELGEKLANEEPGPLPPLAPDNGFAPPLLATPAAPIPAAAEENFVCLRGPCRFFLQLNSIAEVDAPTLDHQPEQINRFCRAIPGIEIDLTDDNVFACTGWDPDLSPERGYREDRRVAYLNANPRVAEADALRQRRKDNGNG